MMETLRGVACQGYRRIDAIFEISKSAEDDLARTGVAPAFRSEGFPRGGWLGIRTVPQGQCTPSPEETLAWLTAHRAKVAVVFPRTWPKDFLALGVSIPKDIPPATPFQQDIPSRLASVAGCDAAGREYGACAADLIFPLPRSGGRGPAAHPVEEVIEPRCGDGATLPARADHRRKNPGSTAKSSRTTRT